MKTITDTRGQHWQVGDVYVRRAIDGYTCRNAGAAQIAPGYGQLNVSPVGKGGNHRGLALPEHLIHAALAGTVRIAIS